MQLNPLSTDGIAKNADDPNNLYNYADVYLKFSLETTKKHPGSNGESFQINGRGDRTISAKIFHPKAQLLYSLALLGKRVVDNTFQRRNEN